MSDTWVATDGLGRTLPTYDEVGGPRSDRFVGLFYFLWLGPADSPGPFNVDGILSSDPNALNDASNPAWGPVGAYHHWDEPYFGYYLSDDPFVLQKHAQMLADAGVDAIFFDNTNGITYQDTYMALLDAFATVRQNGGSTPQIAFLTPFGNPTAVVETLYQNLYSPRLHPELWFQWKGKPLILADPDTLGSDQLAGTTSDPSPLSSGDTQGQTFTATDDFQLVGALIPTYTTTNSSMTLSLYETGPGGTLLATQRFQNVADNSQIMLRLDNVAAAGTYYLEQSAPTGSIGWWSDDADDYGGGQAYKNGVATPGDRTLFITYATPLTQEIQNFFTFRKPIASYFTGPTAPDQWGWLDVYPQPAFNSTTEAAEQMTVGVAQNAAGGQLGAMSEPNSLGRSYHDGQLPPNRGASYNPETVHGFNVQEQWDRALAVDPEFIFVTGWNEWIALHLTSFNGVSAPVVFVDECDWEHSRDIEPVNPRFGPGTSDAYYYQLVANIRRYKGARPIPDVSKPQTIHIDGNFAEWSDVYPEFRDQIGDTTHRNHPGWGTAGPYVNTSGRNDIILAKVARDERNLYFYVRTRDDITPWTDPHWMMLLLHFDADPRTGWEGYQYIVNRAVKNNHVTSLEASRGGWDWSFSRDITYEVRGNELELAIPRGALGLEADTAVKVDFKWVDNMQHEGEILDFIGEGDVAPNGRFNYRYQE